MRNKTVVSRQRGPHSFNLTWLQRSELFLLLLQVTWIYLQSHMELLHVRDGLLITGTPTGVGLLSARC
jgi:hypothetical protein